MKRLIARREREKRLREKQKWPEICIEQKYAINFVVKVVVSISIGDYWIT